jgi:electron transfer flavoprotein alpha subunit
MNSIWVFAEQWRGRISEITFELLALGRELADASGAQLRAILLGHQAGKLAELLGKADAVTYVDDPLLAEPVPEVQGQVLAQLMKSDRPDALLVPLTNVSMGVATLAGADLGVPAINFCRDVRVVDGQFHALCTLYGGKIEATITVAREPAIFGVWPGARRAEQGRADNMPPVEQAGMSLERPEARFKRYIDPEPGDVDLAAQDALVAVGRGIQSRDNLGFAENLAQSLGGAVCGSRPVIDQGWLPLSRQIGKSGLTVKPKLYVAAGISGAPEHIEGMKDAGLILAINSDPNAPIVNVAHVGIVGDVLDVLPELAEEVRVR